MSVFPASPEDRRHLPSSDDTLSAANGSVVRSYGTRNVPLILGKSSRSFIHSFHLADVMHPILGADFFQKERLGIDLWRRQLWDLDRSDWSWSRGVTPGGAESSICSISSSTSGHISIFRALLDEFPKIQCLDFHAKTNKHGVKHYVMTSGPPIHSRARRLDEAKLASAKAEFAKMEKEGIIRRSNSPWALPLHCVPKPDGSFRPCEDYRRLNSASRDDRYPLPFIADFTAGLDPNASGPHWEDSSDNAFRLIRVPLDAIWAAEFHSGISEIDGLDFRRHSICFLLHRRRFGRESRSR